MTDKEIIDRAECYMDMFKKLVKLAKADGLTVTTLHTGHDTHKVRVSGELKSGRVAYEANWKGRE